MFVSDPLCCSDAVNATTMAAVNMQQNNKVRCMRAYVGTCVCICVACVCTCVRGCRSMCNIPYLLGSTMQVLYVGREFDISIVCFGPSFQIADRLTDIVFVQQAHAEKQPVLDLTPDRVH